MDRMIEVVSGIFTFFASSFLAYRLLLSKRRNRQRVMNIAFLHPNCNAGGGGERVLWMSIAAAQKAFPTAKVTIYGAFGGATFGIKLERSVNIIRLFSASLISPKYYPRLTMALQAFGMFILGLECILRFRPNIVIDTQGCAFAYPWFWIAAVPIVAYVHYPFISFDMISAVSDGRVTVNNSFIFAHSRILSAIKMQYYRLLAVIYGVCGAAASLAMVNSTWTQDHIRSLWRWTQCSLVYPPCDLSRMQAFDIQEEREPIIFSLAQFRPEKNQLLQVHILKRLFERRPEWSSSIKLIFYGGCRNKADEGRARAIEKLAEEIGIRVHVNVDHEQILARLSQATIGIHTMVDEHFGINIVEFMASGLIVVANKSGGPQSDIIKSDSEGFLCSTMEEYAETLEKIIAMPEANRREIREKARSVAISRFDSTIFEEQLIKVLASFCTPLNEKKVN